MIVPRRLVRLRALAACIVVLGAFMALSGCSGIDAQQKALCEALVPLVEPTNASITLHRITVDTETAPRVTVLYRTELAANAEDPKLTEVHTVICQFAGTGYADGRLMLEAVETSKGALSETQLLFLNTRWLSDVEALTAAQHSLLREGQARVQGVFELDADSGYFLQQIINSGPPTALYALLALAYSLVYGLTNRINLAFGEIATIGAFGALIGVLAAVTFGAPQVSVALPLALILAFAIAGGAGAAIGKTVFLPLLVRSSQPLLVATIGLALVIQEFLARAQGVHERWLEPILADAHRIADGPFEVVVTTMQLVVTGGSALLIIIVVLAIKYSHLGRLWRAVADDRTMARMLGVNVDRVIVVSFAAGSGLAGIGGAILTLHYGGTSFAMGATIGLKALVAAIVGGIGSLPGAVIGGLALGLTESLWSAYEPIVWRDGVVFTALIVFLILRPQGVLGVRRALEEREGRP
jgi:branched-chain amino acid transport system permease protein